jgi:hypothetical protein
VIAGPAPKQQWDDYIRALDYRFTAEDEALIDRSSSAAIPRRRVQRSGVSDRGTQARTITQGD